jgi:predicted 2-oxoglutarate/Fe(II)-dependent dioxygenase YbiX
MLNDHEWEAADPSNIVIVENFISEEDLKEIYRYCYSINEWESQSMSGTDKISTSATMKAAAPELHAKMSEYVLRMQKMIEYKFGRRLEPGTLGIRRWDEGECQGPHADGETFDGVPNDTYIVDYGSILYLNDNYAGGELYFPAYDICFKPSAGTLAYFPSSTYYVHGVHPVSGGIRYTSPHFWVPVKHRKLTEMFNK